MRASPLLTLSAAALAPLLLSACGYRLSRREPPPIDAFAAPPTGQAQVCVLRPRLAPSGLIFAVHDNGKLVGATRGSSYFCYYAEPGPHRVTSKRTGAVEEAVMALEGGQRYFIYQNVDPYPDATRSWLSWTSEADARSMVGECVYRVVTGAASGDERPGERPVAKADPQLAVPAAKAQDSSSAAREEKKEPEPPQVAPAPVSAPGGEPEQQITDARTTPLPPPTKKKRRKGAPVGPRELGGGSGQ